MKEEIQAHINEIVSYLDLIESGLFPGKNSNNVNKLKNYFNNVLCQLIELKKKTEENVIDEA